MTTLENAKDIILVTGATGKTGRRIAARLHGAGFSVRHGSRQATPQFDWEDEATWPLVLVGTSAVYVCFQPDLAVPGAVDTVRRFFGAASAAGVRRLVLLSGRGEAEAVEAEDALRQFGVPWTIIRASWFAQNFDESVFLPSVRSGALILPVGDVREPFVDIEDLADIAFEALTSDRHDGQLYECTGPDALTFADAARLIGHACGREIRVERISQHAFDAGLREAAVPEEFIALMRYLFTSVLDGRNASTSDGVQRALGRAPRDFAAYSRNAAATGVWRAD